MYGINTVTCVMVRSIQCTRMYMFLLHFHSNLRPTRVPNLVTCILVIVEYNLIYTTCSNRITARVILATCWVIEAFETCQLTPL